MRRKFLIPILLNSAIISVSANCYIWVWHQPKVLYALIPLFLYATVLSGAFNIRSRRPAICMHGTVLLYAFCIALIASIGCQLWLAVRYLQSDHATFIWNLVVCIAVLSVVFWEGILCVYFTSAQLGFWLRLLGLVFGMFPPANLVILMIILHRTTAECAFEIEKELLNKRRKREKLCATKYPLLLVHGFFFRDSKVFNYWGRIPHELKVNGATIFYGNHPSAASVADSAALLKERILQIMEETGAHKVNIIAHSKGGLDCRYAISQLGMAPYVASLTTINTPHRGCLFADYLLTKISVKMQNAVARSYDSALRTIWEEDAHFMAAVTDLTESRCKALDSAMPTPEGIFCQSVGSVLAKARHGKFPLNFSYRMVKQFSGDNDGIVSADSFAWGEKYILLKASGKHGISHGDIIDLNRENLPGFDVREFYVQLVHDLKKRGL